MTPELKEFLSWHKSEVENGLVDIKFTPGSSINQDTTKEDFAAENNRINRLIANGECVSRPDVF